MSDTATLPLPMPAGFPPDTDFYTVSVWGGMPNYACRWCAMDSLDPEYIMEHIEKHSLPITDPDYRPSTKLVDARGNPLMVPTQ